MLRLGFAIAAVQGQGRPVEAERAADYCGDKLSPSRMDGWFGWLEAATAAVQGFFLILLD